MKKMLFLFCALPLMAGAQSECAVKTGNNYFIRTQHMITINDAPAVDVYFDDNNTPFINVVYYDAQGKLQATVKENKLISGDATRFPVLVSDTEISMTDEKSGTLVFMLRQSTKNTKYDCEWGLFANVYLPDGNFFYLTPDESNVPQLKYMNGSTFKGGGTGINLNFK